MTASEMVVFGLALFGALAALLQWRTRRIHRIARMQKGLRDYVSAESNEQPEDSLSTALERS